LTIGSRNCASYCHHDRSPLPITPFVLSQHWLVISGQGPKGKDGKWRRGRVGLDVSPQQAYEHARLAGTRLLSVAKAALGNIDRIERVVKVGGFVNAAPGYQMHPAVINGCSDLLVEIFGEKGRHARSAVGVISLPENITVGIEAVMEIALLESMATKNQIVEARSSVQHSGTPVLPDVS
jgi:enamine deaminase RidA (YjgF/YER057c/UK114 family)